MSTRVLLFGDSITYGDFDSRGGWANRLFVEYLNANARNLDAKLPCIYNLGISGDITRGVIKRLPHEVKARRSLWSGKSPFAFVFAIGINDSLSSNGKGFSSPEQYTKDLRDLYNTATAYTDQLLFVGLTPVEDTQMGNMLYSNERIWQFEQALRAFAAEKSLPFVPVFEVFKKRMNDGEKLFVDGLHPNDTGHELLHNLIKPQLAQLLA